MTGLGEIVEALVDKLINWGVDLRLGSEVKKILQTSNSYSIEMGAGDPRRPTAYSGSAALCKRAPDPGFAPGLSRELGAIEYVSTATVSLAYRERDLPRSLDGYGYVIPRREGRKALACTWTSTKFPHRAQKITP